jgi:hypothetical protein
MGTLKNNLKKIGRIATEWAKRYWTELRSKKLLGVPYFVWVVLLYYTLKGIAALLFIHFILNA